MEALRTAPEIFHSWIDRFDGHLKARNYSEKTRLSYRGRLCLFAGWARRSRGLAGPAEVTPEVVGSYQAFLVDTHRTEKGRPIRVSTQMQRLVPVKRFFQWLSDQDHASGNPAAELVLPVQPKTLPRDVPTSREVGQVLRNVFKSRRPYRLRDAAAIAFLFASGARNEEARTLRIQDINLRVREIRIEKTKNRQGRLTFLAPWAAELVSRYVYCERPRLAKGESEAMFLTRDGKPLSSQRLSDIVSSAFSIITEKRVTCHSLRHAFCVALLHGGANVRIIAELAGHKRLASTAVYTKLELPDLRKVHEKAFREDL